MTGDDRTSAPGDNETANGRTANGSQPPRDLPPIDAAPGGRWATEVGEPQINPMEYLRLAWAGRWIIVFTAISVLVLSLAWALTRKDVYRAWAAVSIDASAPQFTRNQFYLGTSLWEQERYIYEQERVLRSFDLAQRVVERIGLDLNPELSGHGPSADALLAMLEVEPVPEASILNLAINGSDPDRIAEWLNIYIDEFIRFNIEDSLRRTQQVYEVIQSKLAPLFEQLKNSEHELTRFKERRDSLLSADQDKNVISEQVNTLTTEFAQVKAERIRLETKISALETASGEAIVGVNAPEMLNDSTIRSLRGQRDQLEVKLEEALKTYREGHPVIRDLRGRIDAIGARIEEQVTVIIASLRSGLATSRRREQSLYDSLQQLRDETIELGKQTMAYETLKREYEQNKAFYEEMLARSKEAEISGTVSFNRVRIIDRAWPPTGPVSPNVPRSAVAGCLMGLCLGLGLVFLLDYLDQSLRTPDDVERHLGLEVLAVVPIYAGTRLRATLEVFQGLRTALMFAARDDAGQVVMVTSAGPGEGKTTTALNLGKVLAAAGSRVLLIDGDLRKPALHRLLDLERGDGLTSVVLGEKSLAEVLRPCTDHPGLDVLTTGPLPPNPPVVFGKTSFRRLLDNVLKAYEWILIDTPPVISVTDAVVCSNLADMVLFVVEYGRLDRKVIQGAMRQLVRGGSRIAGTVLNKVDLERKDYYYESHYYSYYYGYQEDGSTPGSSTVRKA